MANKKLKIVIQETPAGMRVRTKLLDKDLVLVPESGWPMIMADEFFNVYDKTGDGYSNHKPKSSTTIARMGVLTLTEAFGFTKLKVRVASLASIGRSVIMH